jgi:hypothetical protein
MDMTFLTIGTKYTRPELAQHWGYESPGRSMPSPTTANGSAVTGWRCPQC